MTPQFPTPPLAASSRRSALVWAVAGGGVLAATTGMLVGLAYINTWAAAAAWVLYLGAAVIVVTQAGRHHPHPRFGGGNAVTLARLVITCSFAAFTVHTFLKAPPESLAWGFFAAVLVAMLLDGIDGYLARRQGLASVFGARFDMETDAFLILLLSVAAFTLGKAGAWVMLGGALRYLFVAAGWLWPALAAPLPPSHRRKFVCVIQIAALTLQLAPVIAPPLSTAIAFAALVLLVYSFAVDVLWSLRHGMSAREAAGPSISA